MLGFWSLGDYDHQQSLRWGWELLTDGLGLDRDRLGVTVFGGDDRCGPDIDSLTTWRQLGVPPGRITPLTDPNWWEGPDGMCGPDSEVFYWTGHGDPVGDPSTDERWVEVWNHVSMRYQDTSSGLRKLPRPCVDTGMGLERILMVLQDVQSVYDTDLLSPWTEELSGRFGLDGWTLRRCSDHLRAVCVMVSDGVRPSNSGRGYVLRRLVRRVLGELWRPDRSRSLSDLDPSVVEHTLQTVGGGDSGEVLGVLDSEQRRFGGLLDRGRRLVERELHRGPLTDERVEWLRDTHGLPPELTRQLEGEIRG